MAEGKGLRQRNRQSSSKAKVEDAASILTDDNTPTKEKAIPLNTGTYWLTRIVLLRYLAYIYFVAFLVALHQNKQLLGKDGLLPADKYLDNVRQHTGGITLDSWTYVPSLLWLVDFSSDINLYLDYLAYAGLLLSGFIIVVGGANWLILAALWLLYHSIVNVGQRWFSFGWESQLLESGFLCIFLCPVWSLNPVPRGTPTSKVVIWGNRWLIFRIMIGAGLIKIRGDKCWRDLTCMNYHYETQPVPNPVSYYLHQSPEIFHKLETSVNHFVELVAPFLLILPRKLMMVGGLIQILFQVVLIISGNLSFLNWLTILPSLACFDDASLQWLFPGRRGSNKWRVMQIQQTEREGKVQLSPSNYIRRVYNIGLGCLLVYLSIPVVQNLFSSRQAMNTSFDSLRLVNTYGAFGSITKTRTEIIVQGTYDLDPHSPSARWEDYEFKCKPGNVTRRPCLISPYHYRLDWLMWFAAFQNYQHNPWLVHLAVKLLANDTGATSLIEHNPFQGKTPPLYIRAEHYRYRYTKINSKEAKEGKWWKRKYIGNYLPPISLSSITDFMEHMGWKIPRLPAK